MRFGSKAFVVLIAVLFFPIAASAQATIAGAVKDASGAVLPGVTVEASSPALIEKVRTVVTDGTGQYRIVDLRPGAYTVTFTLPGFSTVKREGVELTGSFVATIDAEMRVGAIEETITVTGETPIVDVQSATRQRVLDAAIIDTIPTNRTHYSLTVLIPGITTTSQDVGGAAGNQQGATMSIHGGRGDDMRVTQSGISLGTLVTGGAKSANTYNMGAVQEVTIDYAAASAELGQGGVRVNLIPKDGGNSFKGTGFFNFANNKMQDDNYTQGLKNRGLRAPDALEKLWSINPGFGGPLKRDRLWFYGSYQNNGAYNRVAGMFYNKNANNPNAWTYEPDTGRPAINHGTWGDAQFRVTWQASPRNKIGVTYDRNFQCNCPGDMSATTAPEAGWDRRYPYMANTIADWSSPATSRVLLEAVVIHRWEKFETHPAPGVNPAMISVTDQFNNLTYRVRQTTGTNNPEFVYYRAAMAYVTGAHAFKVGFNNGWHALRTTTTDVQPVSYRVNSASGVPVPNQITLRATPHSLLGTVKSDGGIFVQDKWTIDRVSLYGGLRYDFDIVHYPEQHLGPGALVPSRNLTLPERDGISWKDLTPKMGASYDLFGNGKTAVKGSANKYVAGQGLSGPFGASLNPVNLLVLQTTRNWNDANRNFVPDCDLTNPAANGECAAMANANFGNSVPGNTYDPDTLTGWGKRPYNWEFSAGVQHEIVPRVSVDVGYFRRIFGNFVVTDNRAVSAADYNTFSITAPSDPRLPNGGGYTVAGLYDVTPAKFTAPTDNYLTFSDNYGKQTEHWNGVDVSALARLTNGVLLQGGVSTGRTTTDVCEVAAKVPEALFGLGSTATGSIGAPSGLVFASAGSPPSNVWTPLQFCRQQSPFLTQAKGLASYTIPRIDVQFSAAFQSIPGPVVAANYVATNAVVVPSLGRPLAGGAANITVNILEPGALYIERLNQLDIRIGKIIRFGRARSTVSLDVYNLLNRDTVLTENPTFTTWRTPQSILTARFAKVGVQIDF
jgi:hypothetical protein